ncbi:MAG: ABC transporter permease [Thermoproteota archaeon]|nr:ABC transporter permease [Thermoproteota archaeon]
MNIKSKVREFKKSMKPTVRELRFMLSRLKDSPLSIMGVTILAFFVAVAILAPILAAPTGEDPYRMPHEGWSAIPKPPDSKHIFGTTSRQYDIYYGCVWGTRTAFRVGIEVVGVALLISLALGTISGYYGGIVDEIVMRFTDIIYAFPGLILAMALVVAFGRSLDSVLLALVLVGWPTYTRVIRAEVLKVKQEDYIEAAKSIGCSDLRVITKHVLPNAIYTTLIMASLDIGAIVLTAAALSFLGLGAGESYADWGQLISNSRGYLTGTYADPLAYWHTYTIPGVFIFTFVLGWNLLGDAFRDILDPTIRRR